MDATEQMLRKSESLLNRFRAEITKESPIRIHSAEISDDGSPQWHSEFARWLTARESQTDTFIPNPEHRLRTTRAMRKLRRTSVRGYEVTLRTFGGEKVEDTTRWLNDRARRNAIPLPPGRTFHYSQKDTLVILYSSLTYMEWAY